MYTQYFDSFNPPVNQDEVLEFEMNYNIEIPNELKSFYLAMNGGYLKPNFSQVQAKDGFEISIGTIEPFKEMIGFYNALKMADSDGLEDYCSNRFLPIAQMGFAFLCVDFSKINSGKIFFIETNNPLNEKEFPIHFIASSLSIFFSMLGPES